MDIRVNYIYDKSTYIVHTNIDKWEIKGNLLYLYRNDRIDVVYNINKIISFYKVN